MSLLSETIENSSLRRLQKEDPEGAELFRIMKSAGHLKGLPLTAKEKEDIIRILHENMKTLEIVDEPYEPKC